MENYGEYPCCLEPPDVGSGRVESLADLLRAFNHQDRVGHPYLQNGAVRIKRDVEREERSEFAVVEAQFHHGHAGGRNCTKNSSWSAPFPLVRSCVTRVCVLYSFPSLLSRPITIGPGEAQQPGRLEVQVAAPAVLVGEHVVVPGRHGRAR